MSEGKQKRRAAKPVDISKLRSPMERIRKEPEMAYRCFLLWAMQNPRKRNQAAAGRAVERHANVVLQWKKRWSWIERANTVELPDVTAQAIYRKKFYDRYKLRELIEVEKYLSVPFMQTTPIPETVAEEVSKATSPTKQGVKEKKHKQEMRRRHKALVDGAIGLLARRIAAGEIKCSMRDLPILLKIRNEYEDNQIATDEKSGFVIETVRVKQAKAIGEDILTAMLEDAREAVAILGALVAANELKSQNIEQQSLVASN
jgi:hypothetical protein